MKKKPFKKTKILLAAGEWKKTIQAFYWLLEKRRQKICFENGSLELDSVASFKLNITEVLL